MKIIYPYARRREETRKENREAAAAGNDDFRLFCCSRQATFRKGREEQFHSLERVVSRNVLLLYNFGKFKFETWTTSYEALEKKILLEKYFLQKQRKTPPKGPLLYIAPPWTVVRKEPPHRTPSLPANWQKTVSISHFSFFCSGDDHCLPLLLQRVY